MINNFEWPIKYLGPPILEGQYPRGPEDRRLCNGSYVLACMLNVPDSNVGKTAKGRNSIFLQNEIFANLVKGCKSEYIHTGF